MSNQRIEVAEKGWLLGCIVFLRHGDRMLWRIMDMMIGQGKPRDSSGFRRTAFKPSTFAAYFIFHIYICTGWMIGSSSPGRSWEFFSSPLRPDQLLGPPRLSNGHQGLFPWGQTGRCREGDHSSASSYTCTPPVRTHGADFS